MASYDVAGGICQALPPWWRRRPARQSPWVPPPRLPGGPGRCRSPRHRMPCNSRNEGSKCVSITWQAIRHRMPFDSRHEGSKCVGWTGRVISARTYLPAWCAAAAARSIHGRRHLRRHRPRATRALRGGSSFLCPAVSARPVAACAPCIAVALRTAATAPSIHVPRHPGAVSSSTATSIPRHRPGRCRPRLHRSGLRH